MRWSLLLSLALTLSAQTSFEVASVRPSNKTGPSRAVCGVPNSPPENVMSGAESVLIAGERPLSTLIQDAYEGTVDTFAIPEWAINAGRFAVSVNIPPNTNVRACREMLRNPLTERFHLVTAVETRPVGRYYLKVAKSGPKLKPVENPPADLNAVARSSIKDGIVHYVFRGAPITTILDRIGTHTNLDATARGFLDNPGFQFIYNIVDETGLTGFYDINLDLPQRPDLTHDLTEPLEDAVTRQLGLTLEFRKGPGKVLVIRSGDRTPTEN